MRGKDAQQRLVSLFTVYFHLISKNNDKLMLLLADVHSSESEDSEDESYTASIALSVSLGSQDTEIEEDELQDLAIDAATMPTPKPVRKKSPVPSATLITAKKKRLSLPSSLPLLLETCLYRLSAHFLTSDAPTFPTTTRWKTSTSSGLMCMLLLCLKIFSAMQEFCLEVKSWHGSLAFQSGGVMRLP